MVALHRDEVFTSSPKSVRQAVPRGLGAGLDGLPFNWRLVSALAINVAVWGGVIAGVRALIH